MLAVLQENKKGRIVNCEFLNFELGEFTDGDSSEAIAFWVENRITCAGFNRRGRKIAS